MVDDDSSATIRSSRANASSTFLGTIISLWESPWVSVLPNSPSTCSKRCCASHHPSTTEPPGCANSSDEADSSGFENWKAVPSKLPYFARVWYVDKDGALNRLLILDSQAQLLTGVAFLEASLSTIGDRDAVPVAIRLDWNLSSSRLSKMSIHLVVSVVIDLLDLQEEHSRERTGSLWVEWCCQ